MPEPGEVSFRFDAPEISTAQFASHLGEITRRRPIQPDAYSRGGVVQELETAMARVLGKEAALFMPTGTLANHLAVRRLAAGRSRVLLQEQGHLWNDCGDCLQRLSGLTGVPLGAGRATFSLEEAEAARQATDSGRVQTRLGVMAIESPVRRRHGEMFDRSEMQRLCSWGRRHGLGLHLDGARLFIASACTGIAPAEYAAGFDTVYVSLYKYFEAPSGALLAGPAGLLEGLHHERRMFGGGLNQAWIFAAAALEGLEGIVERFRRAMDAAAALKGLLAGRHGFAVTEVPNGTNVFRIDPPQGTDLGKLQAALRQCGVLLPEPEEGGFWLKANESILRTEPEALAALLAEEARRARG
jgi:threonine aldolase